MRKEPFTVGSYVHIIKRGARGTSIVRDDHDRWRFLLMLRHFNDIYKAENWFRALMDENMAQTLKRPTSWPEQRKIVEILCFCLLDNHFHLLLKEIKKGGVATFMHKLGAGMANHFNEKYEEKGSLFQGAYRSRTVDNDDYLRYVSAYIQVKNTFELYPGGAEKAAKEFEKAYAWAATYPYASLGDYARMWERGIICKDILGEVFPTSREYKTLARDFVSGKYQIETPAEFE